METQVGTNSIKNKVVLMNIITYEIASRAPFSFSFFCGLLFIHIINKTLYCAVSMQRYVNSGNGFIQRSGVVGNDVTAQLIVKSRLATAVVNRQLK